MKKNPDTEQNSFNVSRIYLVHYKGISIATLGDVSGGFGVFAIDESCKRAISFPTFKEDNSCFRAPRPRRTLRLAQCLKFYFSQFKGPKNEISITL